MGSGIKRFIVLFLILSWVGSSFAQPALEQGVLHATLTNGLRVVIVQNNLAPVVAMELNYLVGSNEAPDGFPGMAHAQEHMMFRGSPGLSAEQLANIMALMGGDFNANTQQTVTQYIITVPKDVLDVALQVEAVRMRDVLDTEDLWVQERGAIEQEVAQDISNPEYILSKQLLGEMFAGTSYANDALGTRPSFEKTTGAMLKQFYTSWYAPNNAILIIVGDIDPHKTLATIKELFEPIPKRPIPARAAINLHPMRPAAIKLDANQSNGLAVVAFRFPGFESPDFAAGSILADVLDSKRSELYALVPTGKALSTSFDGGALPKASYVHAMAAFPQGANGNALITTIKSVIEGYVKNGVSAEMVEAAKRHEIADMEYEKNSIAGLAAAWSQAVAVEGRTSPDDYLNSVKKVSVEDVNRVAREYLNCDSAITAVLTPHPSGKPVASKGFGGKESFEPKKMKPVELPLWARKVAVVQEPTVSNVRPFVTDLANGIRLIVQPENISQAVTVIGKVKNNDDLEEPEGKEGVSDMLGSLFSYGTTSLDRLAFQKAQDDIAADITAGLNFSLKVPSDHFERGMELLAQNLLRPALPEPAFAVVQREMTGALRGQLQSPDYLSTRVLREALYPGNDPVLRDATPRSVSSLSPQDVRSYYAKVFRPDMTTMVIIGRVSPDQARAVVDKYFGNWKSMGPRPATDLPPVPLNKPSVSIVPNASSLQDQVTLAETIGVTRSHPDYYKLQLGNHVLSGAFYATRLYRDLREDAGLVYTVESLLEAGKTRSTFEVFYACDPSNVAKARSLVVRNLHMMQTTPISHEELNRTKALLARKLPLAEANIDDIAEELLSLSVEDLPLNEPVRAAENYLAITAEQLRDAFAKWIRPDDFVQIIVGPNP